MPSASKAIVAALDKLDRVRSPKDNGAAATLEQIDTLASQVEKDAAPRPAAMRCA